MTQKAIDDFPVSVSCTGASLGNGRSIFLIYVFAWLDRLTINMMIAPVKASLNWAIFR
jgi:hypothetical protein